MIVSAAVAFVVAQGGFDTSQSNTSTANVLGWITEAVQSAVAEAQWLKQVRELGPTVVAQPQYLMDADIVDLATLRVAGSLPWARTNLDKMWRLEAGYGWVRDAPGAFAQGEDAQSGQDVSNAQKWVRLWPVPTTAGQSIEADCAVQHPAFAASDATVIQIPDDIVRSIAVDGAIGLGLQYAHGRADLAAGFMQSWADGKKRLEKRTKSRMGSGPHQAQVGR
jgi:hypothetical protein